MTKDNLDYSSQMFKFKNCELELKYSLNWSSKDIDHRRNIHVQKPDNDHCSISHCPTVGGIIITNQSCGLDFEVSSRVTGSILKRVSTIEELNIIPPSHQSCLWSIKESAFKVMRTGVLPDFILKSFEVSEEAFEYLVFSKRHKKEIYGTGISTFGGIVPNTQLCISIEAS